MKTKEEVKTESRTVFYAVLFESMRKAALELGYALALHGSMQSDMDMIAVAWVEDAEPVESLVKAINDCLGRTYWTEHNFKTMGKKPHGRIVYTLSIMGDWYIDLSIIPPKNDSEELDNKETIVADAIMGVKDMTSYI